MTLEDFFTSSELKDGLTTPDRVKELITVMQSEKDLVNVSQTTRQWSTVATIIAATENKNCLDLFINLGGSSIINKWLKVAQKLQNDNENGAVEEVMIALLRALERLQLDKESVVNSEIGKTVLDLGGHCSSRVREKCKSLCDSWMLTQEKIDEAPKYVKNPESSSGDNTETSPPSNKEMDSVNTNQEVLDCVEASCKSTVNVEKDNLVKDILVEKLDVKDEREINFGAKGDLTETLIVSSSLEQIASSADVDNLLQPSSRNTDVLSDKDEEMVDDGESPKISSNSEGDREADTSTGDILSNGNTENGLRYLKFSINSKASDMELDYGMIDPLDIAGQVANEMEQHVDSQERSCSTTEKMLGGGIDKQSRKSTADSVNGLDSQTPVVAESNKEISSGPVPEHVKDAETLVSQISEVAQESEPDTGRRFSGFDLNQDVCSEEDDNPVSEGRGTREKSKQQSEFLDFDLNVADDSEDKMEIVSGPPSGEESSVANPRLLERPQLDLNSIIGDNRNGWQSPSRSSSSSSKSKLPLKRNIDLNLNDQHIFSNDDSFDNSVISIFGKKVQVPKKDPFIEPKMDFGLGRPLESSLHYAKPDPNPGPNSNPPFYGHHNGMFFTVPMYGSSHSIPMQMPYMLDSRGAPFVPQVMPSQQPSPFIMNMTATGGPHLQQNVDLNTGLMINGGNRETNRLRQLFPIPQNVDERYLRPNNSLQAPSSSTVGVKRHEPESRFDFVPVNKHHQPPWR
ncbi:uncharacterized protein [Rutidosis leptorrhynchoides]|uniref:uncharacterized protein n=1 Tax=Rutidosis leptorrhynchoides TaxID=125765 RepID=UPI003A9A2041